MVDGRPMTAAQHQVSARRFYDEACNTGSLELLDELLSPEIVAHDALPRRVPNRGVESYRQTSAMFRSAFPDARWEVHDVIAEGDTAAVRVTMTGTHRGGFLSVAPTGRHVQYPGMDFFRFADGKIVEHRTATDDLGLLRQLGAIPTSEPWSAPMPS
jgi:steroid delta-isomerase-like uncharacterized protein